MKILLATYWNVPHLGGVWNYMQQLKKSLEERGHEVDLMGYGEENTIVHKVNTGEKVEKSKLLPFLQAKFPLYMYPNVYTNKLVEFSEFHRYLFELGATYLGLEKYDLIHTQDVISTASIKRVKPQNTPLIATLHGSVAHEIRHQLTTIHQSPTSHMAREYYDELERLGATSSDLTIVANHWLENILRDEFGVPQHQLRVLHYGFDSEEFIKQKSKQSYIDRPINKKVIIYSGRLTELKGVNYLIQALANLKAIRQDWICWIVGTGDKQEELQLLAKSLNLDNDISFLGSRDDVPALLSKADIYVLPSIIENQPLSLIEAQLAGKPSIVSNVGGLPEMIENNVTGLLVEPKDVYGLFISLNRLLTDSLFAKNLGENAKKWGMTHWSFENGIRNLLKAYDEVLLKKKTGDING
ncbi:glycosyltransferase family 4 protein [Rummeliibacillus suwonensis]|uniref:glycosyltransferase family 4 protein n=1 Tax=Rummeliibacillus suwonensis TaxID=1306154 RepID=UPI00289B67FB|nr:glycosyltransferase family 4 protein [Rummeliibacillus suwonensis]